MRTSKPLVESIIAIWMELIHNLQGDTKITEKRRKAFYVAWDSSPFYSKKGDIDGLTTLCTGYAPFLCHELPLIASFKLTHPLHADTY